MCGIVGYTGKDQAAPILLDGLSKLEYRGYDSSGIAVRNGETPVRIVKSKGRLQNLQDLIRGGAALPGNCGIGHTRWATHGAPSEINAHPHSSDDGNVVLVHNGIIENHMELRRKLNGAGYTFRSDTDTETAAKLIDYYCKKYRGGPVEALARSMMRIRGSYAFAVMFRDYPGEIFAARKDSPLIIGVGENKTCLASDVPAILLRTRRVYYLDNMEIARLSPNGVRFTTVDQEPVEKQPVEIAWQAEDTQKGGFGHYMLKEIHEQPLAVQNTIHALLQGDEIDISASGLTDDTVRSCRRIHMVACGSAWHAALAAQYVMEDIARVPVRVELASEFRYRNPILCPDELVVIISQSGETADSLAALREAKRQGIRTLAVVNAPGSTIAREADHVIPTCAGPEIAVATTKAYSAQLAVGYLLSLRFARVHREISREKYAAMLAELRALPDKIQQILGNPEPVQRIAAAFSGVRDAFFIGRGADYAAALEGSLKLKEVSYIHSEAYAAGELKHGAISLIENNTPVIALLTQPQLKEKMLSGMAECKSRGGRIILLTAFDIEEASDFTIRIPETDPHFAASLAAIPLQLLAYYISVARGLDVDKPRNLAKSVTVE